jgi:hypothetical protein
MSNLEIAMKAFTVTDECGDSAAIIFARHAVTARRLGANELNCEFGDVSCHRSPTFDEYVTQGSVPARVLIEDHGWHFTCGYCGHHVDDEHEHAVYDYEAGWPYCNPWHWLNRKEKMADMRRLKREAEALARAKWPAIADWLSAPPDLRILPNDNKQPALSVFLTPQNKKYVTGASVRFVFGGRFAADWTVGDETVRVCQCDLEAWNAFKAKCEGMGHGIDGCSFTVNPKGEK